MMIIKYTSLSEIYKKKLIHTKPYSFCWHQIPLLSLTVTVKKNYGLQFNPFYTIDPLMTENS